MLDKFKEDLDEMSYDELDQLVKEIKVYSKDRQKEAKEAIADEARARLKEGDEVVVNYKDGELEGVVSRVGEKSFSVEAMIDGETKKVSRQYHLYIRHSSDVIAA